MARQRGSVRPRRGKIQIRYSFKSQRFSETLDLKPTKGNLAEAKRILEDRLRDLTGTRPTSGKSFKIVAKGYLKATESRSSDWFLEESTRDSYRQLLNSYWADTLSLRPIVSITADDLKDVDQSTDWTSRKTRKNAISAMRQVFSYAHERRIIRDNPAIQISVRRTKTDKIDPDPYTQEEVTTLLDSLSGPAYAYFSTAFATGMRTGELIALNWGDFDGKGFLVSKSRSRRKLKTTKTGESRFVHLPPDVIEILRALPSFWIKGEVFLNQYGRPYNSGYHLNKVFRKAHDETSVRHREGPYPWRHTYASLALKAGVNPSLVAEQLGHSKEMLFRVYSKWIPTDDDRTELSKMWSARGPKYESEEKIQ